MKLWFQRVVVAPSISRFGQVLMNVIKMAARPDTEVDIKTLKKGISKIDQIIYSYFTLLNKREIMEGVLQAEREGYDGVMLGCCLDPALREAREVLNIPITGPGESSMLLAHLMGHKFSIITDSEKATREIERNIILYGFRDRAISINPVRWIPFTSEVFTNSLENPKPLISMFEEAAISCIRDGAEIIIPGCVGMSPILTQAGVKEVDEVPVLDCVVAELKLIELLVDLKKADLTWISRKLLYSPPPKDEIKKFRETLLI